MFGTSDSVSCCVICCQFSENSNTPVRIFQPLNAAEVRNKTNLMQQLPSHICLEIVLGLALILILQSACCDPNCKPSFLWAVVLVWTLKFYFSSNLLYFRVSVRSCSFFPPLGIQLNIPRLEQKSILLPSVWLCIQVSNLIGL